MDGSVTGDSWKLYLAQQAPSPSETPPHASSPLSTGPAWERFARNEAKLESIDWTCRASVYEAHLDSVEAAITTFQTDHAREIEQAQAEWLAIEERAEDVGFHGQVGSLD
ncbi:MAG TPA: hypothetical protein VFJ14_17320 [Nocardioidaceae bacterium]|nr:hypothetical protein [Nocardioidaceae bacterium]